MAMNYTTLTGSVSTAGSIKYAINYDRIDAAGILQEAEAWIYQRLRVRQMVATSNVTISDEASTASFPTGYLDPIHFGIPGYVSTIRLKDAEWFRAHLGWDEDAALPEGPPSYWCDMDTTIQFNTKADQAYTAKMVFFKKPTALSGSNETNWLTDRYPSLLRRVCLMFAAEARKEMDLFNAQTVLAMQSIEEIKVESDLAMRGWEADMNWEENG
jgi:hypothetical protein